MIDGVTDIQLFAGSKADKWRVWWLALSQNEALTQRLASVRDAAPDADHLSILRVADIVTWMRNH